MRKRLALGICLIALGVGAVPAEAATTRYFAGVMGGDQEVPAVVSAGSGAFFGTLSCIGTVTDCTFNYTITFKDLSSVIINPPGSHIHNAAAGVNGPVVHFLDDTSQYVGKTAGTIVGDWSYLDNPRPLTDALAAELLAGRTYFNLHTANFPTGEIRGQIAPVPLPAAVALLLPGLALVGLAGRRRAA